MIKKTIPFFLVLLILSCKNERKLKLSNEFLDGTWIVTNASISDKKITNVQQFPDALVKEENQVLNIYHFDSNNNVKIDTGSISITNGKYAVQDSTLSLNIGEKETDKKFYKVTFLTDSSMTIVTDFSDDNIHYKLLYDYVKIKPTTTFDIGNVEWKKPFTKDATDEEIKSRLKQMLDYYGNYFETIVKSGANVFSEDKVCLPLKFYSGGIGTKDVKKAPEFIKIFGTENNVKKAFSFLSNTFNSKFSYPNKENFVLEYAEAIKHIAKQL